MTELYQTIKTYLTEHQLLVFLCLLKVFQTNSNKNISHSTIYRVYISLCHEYNIEPVFKRGLDTTLSKFETAGLISLNRSTIRLLLNGVTPSDLLNAFLKDPALSKYQAFFFTSQQTLK